MTAQNRDERTIQLDTSELTVTELEAATGGKGSQSTGAGAGKVTFNPFSITRKVDKATPILF
jgi:type VI protein secretion system component Hcp